MYTPEENDYIELLKVFVFLFLARKLFKPHGAIIFDGSESYWRSDVSGTSRLVDGAVPIVSVSYN